MLSMLNGFDLNLLLAFEALERTRSVSRAAERLGLRQPAMSAALARLRHALGDPLFVRAAGAMQPTPKAQRLTPRLLAALDSIREGLSETMPFDPTEARRAFTIAATDYVALVIGPALAGLVAQEAPGVDLRIVGYDKDDVPDLADRGEVDLALGVFQAAPDRVIRQYLWPERFVGIARRGHPALVEGAMTLEAYAACDHVLVSVRRDARGAVDAALAREGLERRVALVLPHMAAVAPIVATSDWVAALPERVARMHAAPGVAIFDLPVAAPAWRVEMIWNAGGRNDPALMWLRSRVLAAVAAR